MALWTTPPDKHAVKHCREWKCSFARSLAPPVAAAKRRVKGQVGTASSQSAGAPSSAPSIAVVTIVVFIVDLTGTAGAGGDSFTCSLCKIPATMN